MQIQRLRKWSPNFKKGEFFAGIFVGSRNSGKSHLVRHLLRDYLRNKYDLFVVVSDSSDTQLDLTPVLPKTTTTYLTDMDYGIVDMLQQKNEERRQEHKEPLTMLIIFDDKIGIKVKNDDRLLQLFTRGRHLALSLIFITQSKKFAETTWINNADYVVLLRANSQQQRKTIIENVLKGTVKVSDDVSEDKYIRQVVETYLSQTGDALIVDCKAPYGESLMWYKAP